MLHCGIRNNDRRAMNLHELTLFKHLAGTLHFGRTSQACHVTASALTRTIQRLEEEVGQPLFLRDNRSVSLTPAGTRFRLYAEEALLHWREFRNDLSANAGRLGGEISLYCSVTAVYSILPGMLEKFRQAYPEIHLKLQTGDAAEALSKLQNGEVDVTIAALPEKLPTQLQFIKKIETPLVFIASQRFPESVIYRDGEVDWRATPMILAERGLGRKRLDRWFKDRGLQPNIYAQVSGNEAIIAMVSLGCGVGVVPQIVLEKSPLQDAATLLEVSPQLRPYQVGVCTARRNMLNPVVQAFWSLCGERS
jgi:LysR family positive regulator for ilvC